VKRYPEENWKALGEWVADARAQSGLSDTKAWATAVGRSSRMLLGLERGEPVGPKTIEAVGQALGVEPWALFGILSDPSATSTGPGLSPSRVRDLKSAYERETGLPVAAASVGLQDYTNVELLREVGRRMDVRAAELSEASDRHLSAVARTGEPEPEDPHIE
jgi:transcriptional regulator with XRE-family HTH domain